MIDINEKMLKDIYKYAKKGLNNDDIATMIGISRASLYNILKQARKLKDSNLNINLLNKEDKKFMDFLDHINKGKIEFKMSMLDVINNSVLTKDKYSSLNAQFILSRKYSTEYSQTNTNNINIKPITLSVSDKFKKNSKKIIETEKAD